MKFHNDDCSKSSLWTCITFQLPDEQQREVMVLKSTLILKKSQSIQVSWADLPQGPANDLSLMGKLKMLTACCRMLLPNYWTISARLGSALRPHHFDVGVCVIPKFFLEIFGAEKKFPE
jgi:hypothetical protein